MFFLDLNKLILKIILRFTRRKRVIRKTDAERKMRIMEKKSLFSRLFHGKPCPICKRLLYGNEEKVVSLILCREGINNEHP